MSYLLSSTNPAVSLESRQLCPRCFSPEVDLFSPWTMYACGSKDYDQRPWTFKFGANCSPRYPVPLLRWCPCCSSFKTRVMRRHRMTAYENDKLNHITCCHECYESDCDYWEERWEEYRGSQGA